MNFPRLRVAFVVIALLLIMCSAFRLAFLFIFGELGQLAADEVWKSLYIGVKLDLRMAVTVVVPFLALAAIPKLNPARAGSARTFWSIHFAILFGLFVVIFLSDLGHYDYLQTRLNAGVFRFLLNPLISLQMVWETYAVIPGVVLSIGVSIGTFCLFVWQFDQLAKPVQRPRRNKQISVVAIASAFLVAGLYGKFSYYPLRWSDAYFSTNQFTADVAMNPLLHVIDTYATAENDIGDTERLRENYSRLADYLGVTNPDVDTLSLSRSVRPTPLTAEPPNVVVIMMESFAAHLTGFQGNPLDASPEFDRFAESGLVFTNFYTPGVGTAHGIYTMFTGIPDVSLNRTASRNPRAIDQHIILNDFEGYEKYYFLGGSANWANIRALLQHNIKDLKLYEEGHFPNSPRADVWGISDLHLFEESHRVLSDANGPFFAFIQLSGNHRPYTIPDDNRGFVPEAIDDQLALENGFDRVDGYNSFRFMDHALAFFIRLAQEEAYFENTLFVLTADNGEIGKVPGPLHYEEASRVSNHHAPFVIFGAPLLREPQRIDAIATQMDIMPTIAGAIGAPVDNLAMGRNLFDSDNERGVAFIHRRWGTGSELLLLDGEYLLTMKEGQSSAVLNAYRSKDPGVNIAAERPDLAQSMTSFAESIYDASGNLLFGGEP